MAIVNSDKVVSGGIHAMTVAVLVTSVYNFMVLLFYRYPYIFRVLCMLWSEKRICFCDVIGIIHTNEGSSASSGV
jgi:hypothetical protein